MSEIRPFNAREVAENIAAGHTVKIGEHLIIARDLNGDVRQVCTFCDAVSTVAFKPTAIALALAKFAHTHMHRGVAS